MKSSPLSGPVSGGDGEQAAARSARALAARRLAASALRQVIERKASLEDALAQSGARSAARLDARDRQFARSMTVITLKRLGGLRAALNARLKKPVDATPPEIAATLLVGAAQILFMAVPSHAAVDVAVELTRLDRPRAGLAGLVNAVLRRIAAERAEILSSLDPQADLPPWLVTRWRAHYGEARAARIATALALEPTLDLTAPMDASAWVAKLGGRLTPNGSIRALTHAPVETLPGYDDGAWFVQDAAAAMPARLLAATKGERIIDLCAAPGGKTMQLASTGASVIAIDRSAPRIERLKQNLARMRLEAQIIVADAASWSGDAADGILLDAPCTGTGTIRRHPDIAWTKSESDLVSLASLQTRLLDHAIDLLKPGGRLVYSTCSLEPEEGERQIDEFIARRRDVARDPVQPHEATGLADAIDRNGALRITPDLWPDPEPRFAGLDGFFVARLRRTG